MKSVALALALLVVTAGCGGGGRDPGTDRPVEDVGRGCAYVLPPHWIAFDSELRSPNGTLLEIRVYDLVDAEHTFLAGLPDTLIPKLEEWGRIYFILEGPPARTQMTVGGEPATELTYTVRARREDSTPSKLIYWVIRHEEKLYVLRASLPAKVEAKDGAPLRAVVSSFRFLAAPATP